MYLPSMVIHSFRRSAVAGVLNFSLYILSQGAVLYLVVLCCHLPLPSEWFTGHSRPQRQPSGNRVKVTFAGCVLNTTLPRKAHLVLSVALNACRNFRLGPIAILLDRAPRRRTGIRISTFQSMCDVSHSTTLQGGLQDIAEDFPRAA